MASQRISDNGVAARSRTRPPLSRVSLLCRHGLTPQTSSEKVLKAFPSGCDVAGDSPLRQIFPPSRSAAQSLISRRPAP